MGIKVSLVELSGQVMEALGFEMAAILQQHLRSKGVEMDLNNGLKKIERAGRKVVLQNGEELDTDMLVMAAGVQPKSRLAEEANLALGNRKSIQAKTLIPETVDGLM